MEDVPPAAPTILLNITAICATTTRFAVNVVQERIFVTENKSAKPTPALF
jgi:hypothetical protein